MLYFIDKSAGYNSQDGFSAGVKTLGDTLFPGTSSLAPDCGYTVQSRAASIEKKRQKESHEDTFAYNFCVKNDW